MLDWAPELTELYRTRKIKITPQQFGNICRKASQIQKDLKVFKKALAAASKAFESLQAENCADKISGFGMSIHKDIPPLSKGFVRQEFKFTHHWRGENGSGGSMPYEGLRIAFNAWNNGFFSVISDLKANPNDSDEVHDWLQVSPSLDDGLAYDVKPDAVAVTDMWLETHYPEALPFFEEESRKRGLREPAPTV